MTIAAAAWSAGATIASPALKLMLHRRVHHGKELANRLPERYGLDPTPRPDGRLIWLHAASVGEAVSLLPVLAEIVRQSYAKVLLTTGTVTSATLLVRRLPELGLADRVFHRFLPLDVPIWVARFLDRWRPDAAGLVESELWPNLIAATHQRHIPMALLNGRLSERSYDAWRRVPGFAAELLNCFTTVQAQSEADADRFRRLGAPKVAAPGNLKFAAAPLPVDHQALSAAQAALAGRPTWLAASTHPGEEELVLQTHRLLAEAHPALVTIVAPRHPERGPEIARLATPTTVSLRSMGECPGGPGLWIADTLGELGLWYRLTGIVVMGRSLIPPGGGQNPLEPARLGCAVACGPFMGNFTEPVRALQEAGAIATLPDPPAIARWVSAMLSNPREREETGRRAAQAATTSDALPRFVAQALLALLP